MINGWIIHEGLMAALPSEHARGLSSGIIDDDPDIRLCHPATRALVREYFAAFAQAWHRVDISSNPPP